MSQTLLEALYLILLLVRMEALYFLQRLAIVENLTTLELEASDYGEYLYVEHFAELT